MVQQKPKCGRDIDIWKRVCSHQDLCGVSGGSALQTENVWNTNRRANQCLLWQRGSYQEYNFPESMLKKKHNSIAYHCSREAVAAGTIRVTKEDGKTNLADVLTKPLAQATKDFLCDRFMYWDWTQHRFIMCHKMLGYLLDMQDMWLWKPGHRFVASNISVTSILLKGTKQLRLAQSM